MSGHLRILCVVHSNGFGGSPDMPKATHPDPPKAYLSGRSIYPFAGSGSSVNRSPK